MRFVDQSLHVLLVGLCTLSALCGGQVQQFGHYVSCDDVQTNAVYSPCPDSCCDLWRQLYKMSCYQGEQCLCSSTTLGPYLTPCADQPLQTTPVTTMSPAATTLATNETTSTPAPDNATVLTTQAPSANVTTSESAVNLTDTPITNTTALPALCSVQTPAARLFKAAPTSLQQYPGCGTVGFALQTDQGWTTLCNGGVATIPLASEKTIFTVNECWEEVQSALNKGQTVAFAVGTQRIPVDSCSFQATADTGFGLTMVSLTSMASLVLEGLFDGCDNLGCIYLSLHMAQAIDWTNCSVISYGASSQGGQTPSSPYSVSVKISDITLCQTISVGTQCFVSADSGYACDSAGDMGAPAYCRLDTGEQVLVGITKVESCLQSSTPSFSVIPVSLTASVPVDPGPNPPPADDPSDVIVDQFPIP